VQTDFDSDRDSDGVPDVLDDCPDSAVKAVVSDSGCTLIGGPVKGIEFEPGSDTLTAGASASLERVLQALADDPDLNLTIAAHTAPSFDPGASLLLSRRRALAVVRFMTVRGIDASRLRPQAFGDTRPLAGARDVGDNERIELLPR
jgi:OOP family OmpA-OmpF porin